MSTFFRLEFEDLGFGIWDGEIADCEVIFLLLQDAIVERFVCIIH